MIQILGVLGWILKLGMITLFFVLPLMIGAYLVKSSHTGFWELVLSALALRWIWYALTSMNSNPLLLSFAYLALASIFISLVLETTMTRSLAINAGVLGFQAAFGFLFFVPTLLW